MWKGCQHVGGMAIHVINGLLFLLSLVRVDHQHVWAQKTINDLKAEKTVLQEERDSFNTEIVQLQTELENSTAKGKSSGKGKAARHDPYAAAWRDGSQPRGWMERCARLVVMVPPPIYSAGCIGGISSKLCQGSKKSSRFLHRCLCLYAMLCAI